MCIPPSGEVIRHPYSNVFMCQFALAQMKAACERAPKEAQYRIALGVAQYRLGRFQKEDYQNALATLSECDPKHPTTLAFLAMARRQLINLGWKPAPQEEPKAMLVRLRAAMKQPAWANDRDAQAFLREAEALIEGKK